MSARLRASIGRMVHLPFVPEEHFLPKILEELERLQSESEKRGHVRLASLIDSARGEAADLNTSEQPVRTLSVDAASDDASDEEGVFKMAERLAFRPFRQNAHTLPTPAVDSDSRVEPAGSPPEPSQEAKLLEAVDAVREEISRARHADRVDGEPARAAKAFKLRLSFEMRDFDMDQLGFSLTVPGKAAGQNASGGYLRMTLEELDTFLKVLGAAEDNVEMLAVDMPQSEGLPRVSMLPSDVDAAEIIAGPRDVGVEAISEAAE